jgi:transposase
MAKRTNQLRGGPAKRPRGRPPECTPELTEKIASAVRGGNYLEIACGLNGISRAALHVWLKRGNDANEKDGRYKLFVDAMQQAIAYAEAADVQVIDRAAKGLKVVGEKDNKPVIERVDPDWKAAAWRLERKNAKRWGRKEQVKHFDAQEGEEFEGESSHAGLMNLIEEKEGEVEE